MAVWQARAAEVGRAERVGTEAGAAMAGVEVRRGVTSRQMPKEIAAKYRGGPATGGDLGDRDGMARMGKTVELGSAGRAGRTAVVASRVRAGRMGWQVRREW